MSDPNHQDSRQNDRLAVALSLLGLAGFVVLVACLNSGQGLWPSFSGERVYTAHALMAAEAQPAPANASAPVEWRPAEVEPVKVSAQERAMSDACGARAKRHERMEAARRQTIRRARLLSRRRTTTALPITTVVDG